MKTSILFVVLALLGGSLVVTGATPREEVTEAAKKLAAASNYGWKTTVVVPEGARFRPGPTDGQTEKDGFTHVVIAFGDNKTHAVRKGEKGAVTNREGEWQSLSELEGGEGATRFLALMVRNIQTPASQALEIAADAKDIQKEGEVYSSVLTEDGAKELMRFRRRNDAGDGPAISNAKGSVKFWLKDGLIAKYEFKVQGTMNFNGNDTEVDRTTTVEVKDVGTTKVEVPEAAKKKVS